MLEYKSQQKSVTTSTYIEDFRESLSSGSQVQPLKVFHQETGNWVPYQSLLETVNFIYVYVYLQFDLENASHAQSAETRHTFCMDQ